MTRRTFAQVAAEAAAAAVAAERRAVVAYAVEHSRQVDGLVNKGRLEAAEADLLKCRIRAFAQGVGAGLHVEEKAHG